MTSVWWRAGALIAAVWPLSAVLAIGAAGVGSTVRNHENAATVPSTPASAPAGRYAHPVERARRLARALVVNEDLPGLSAAVAIDGEVVWAEAFALSKPLTATAAALLQDRGQLDLNTPVQRYVPAYPLKQWPVTARQLMGDVAGVHRIRGDGNDAMPASHCETLEEAVGDAS